MEELVSRAAQKFQKVIDIVRADLATIRTGKAQPALVENLIIDAYGSKMKLVELATIAAFDPTTLLVTPFDIVNAEAIAKAISDANLGLTALIEDTRVRVIVPALSEERRQEYVKLAKTKTEGGKVMIRQIRHEAMEAVVKSELNEDSQKHLEKEIQTLTDKTVAELDLMASEKEKELLTI